MVAEIEGQKPVILLITDSSYYPIYFRHHLLEFETVVRPSETSISEMEKTKPNIIIIDDSQFADSLITICLKVRQQKNFHRTPLLVISGNLKIPYLKKLTEVGVNGIIQEPLDKEDLIHQIKNASHYNSIEDKIDVISLSITPCFSDNDLRLRPLLNKNLLDPIYKTLKEKRPISLLAVAVEFNDKHEFTERHVTETIRRVIKKSHPLFSLGMGKYLLILDQTPKQDAVFIAETLRDVIIHTMHITISIGISSQKKPPYANIHDMIKDAKNALLDAQKKGTTIEIST